MARETCRTIRTESALSSRVHLDAREKEGIRSTGVVTPWRITPYYTRLMDPDDPACPIRRQAIPSPQVDDPLKTQTPSGKNRAPPPEPDPSLPQGGRLVRDRPTGQLAVLLAEQGWSPRPRAATTRPPALREALAYIAATPEIRDVLVTGGDPLMLPGPDDRGHPRPPPGDRPRGGDPHRPTGRG